MRFSDEMRIETPEQIGVDLELAGLGSRFVAQMIDWLWKFVFTMLLVVVGSITMGLLGDGKMLEHPTMLAAALVVSIIYVLWLGAGIYFEVRWNGQTPGKRFAGIRVIRIGGAPLDAQAACVRNLLAVADFLPTFHLLGAILILLTTNRQRLGDLAAGTIVIRERSAGVSPEFGDELTAHASDAVRFTPTQLSALAPTDRAIIRSFLQRYNAMNRDGRERLALKMADNIVRKTGFVLQVDFQDGEEARVFLASLLRDLEEYHRHA
jgi:uncharacterized RDD family membrane protein YckC